MAGYTFDIGQEYKEVHDSHDLIRSNTYEYCNGNLGWSTEKCEERIEWKLDRQLPKFLLNQMEDRRAWNLEDSKLIDIGSGQGGLVLEALTRGADAHGIEPSDKYVHTSRVRLSEEGYNPDRVCCTKGESLPFSDDTFDYACNLYVLEHVPDPEPILKEIYRVLRPGGELHLRCENYLSFREQHYRVPWLPMLPKPIGRIYLLLLGRDPSFLDNYVYYSTYPQVVRIASNIGFENNTYDKMLDKVETLSGITSQSSKLASHLMTPVPASLRRKIAEIILYLRNLFAVGVQLHLVKPLK